MKRKCPIQQITAVFNFGGAEQTDFEINAVNDACYKLIMSSDSPKYGGKTDYRKKTFKPDKKGIIKLNLPPFSAIYFEAIPEKQI